MREGLWHPAHRRADRRRCVQFIARRDGRDESSRCGLAAGMRRPLWIRSSASARPPMTSRMLAPRNVAMPRSISGRESCAVSTATQASARSASIAPPPLAVPFSTAMTGFGVSMTASCSAASASERRSRWRAMSPSCGCSRTSTPAQNTRSPAPVRSTARTRWSRAGLHDGGGDALHEIDRHARWPFRARFIVIQRWRSPLARARESSRPLVIHGACSDAEPPLAVCTALAQNDQRIGGDYAPLAARKAD